MDSGSKELGHEIYQKFRKLEPPHKIAAQNIKGIYKLVITKGYGVRTTTIKVKTLLLQRCALHKFHVTDGQNMHDQIMSD